MSKGLEALERVQYNYVYVFKARENGKTQLVHDLNTIKKELKALEIIKENLVVSYDENNNDKPCLIIGVKVSKDKLVVIYETNDKEKIDLLKEVLK